MGKKDREREGEQKNLETFLTKYASPLCKQVKIDTSFGEYF